MGNTARAARGEAPGAGPSCRPFAWERSYPPGLSWDTPIETSTLPALLDNAVSAYGDRIAVEFRGREISFRELGRRVDAAAAGFMRLGLRPGDAVALYLPNTPWHPVAFFGALRAGAKVVHLSPLDPPRALSRKLADSGARVLVATDHPQMLPAALGLLRQGHAERLVMGEDAAWGPSPAPPPPIPDDPRVARFVEPVSDDAAAPAWPAISPGDVAVLQYTGGTTGHPRAAMLSHANLTAAVSIYTVWNRATGRGPLPTDRTIGVLPLFHIFALTAVLLYSIRHGIEILLRPRFDAETTLRDIEEKRATSMSGVPTMWIALAHFPGVETRDLSALRYCGSGGAGMPHEVALRFQHLTGHRLGGGWGMTETSPAGTTLPADRAYGPGAIGLPLPGIEMQVVALDDPHRVLGVGETGEIRIRGPNVTSGYWNRPEETATAFADGFFLTGDIGRMDADGCFFIVDRKKDMILSGGFNVYPRMIEEAIHEHPDVEEAAVIGVPDAYRGQAAKAFVKLRDGAPELTLDALRAFLSERIGRHELPAALELRDALPHTPVGKLSKRELAEEENASARPAQT